MTTMTATMTAHREAKRPTSLETNADHTSGRADVAEKQYFGIKLVITASEAPG